MSRTDSALGITYVSMAVNVLLGVGKCAVGLASGSTALFADGLHSLTDLATDVAAIFGLKMADHPQDFEHPYGHHKFSSLSQLFIAAALLVFCGALIYQSLLSLRGHQGQVPGVAALLMALLSVGIKEGLYWWTRHRARMLKSRLLMANAWHHRTDSVSSLMVIVALVAVTVGGAEWAFLDEMVGILLALYLMWEGLRLGRQACADLLDAAPEYEILDDLREHILPVPGAVAYHAFRSRRVGDMLEVDLHLQVAPSCTVQEGHSIAKAVKQAILEKHPEVIEVLIHLEPADEEHLFEKGVSDKDLREWPE